MTVASFIEIASEWSQDSPHAVIRKFRHALLAAPGVTKVALHPEGTKEQQNNGGSHYQEHNFVVYTEICATLDGVRAYAQRSHEWGA